MQGDGGLTKVTEGSLAAQAEMRSTPLVSLVAKCCTVGPKNTKRRICSVIAARKVFLTLLAYSG